MIYKIANNKIFLILIVFIMLFSSIIAIDVSASNLNDKVDELEDITQDANATKGQLEILADEIEVLENEIIAKQNDIDLKTEEYNASVARLEEIKLDIERSEEALNGRLRTMYKNSSIGFLDVLLSSASIEEFLSNVGLVQVIHENDVEVLEKLEENQRLVEEETAKIEEQKIALESAQAELESQEAVLIEQQSIANAELAAYEVQAEELKDEIAELQDAAMEYIDGDYAWPTIGQYITSYYGDRYIFGGYSFHGGIDIGEAHGNPIYAAKSGRVILASYNYGSYGHTVIIDHGGGYSTLYAHASSLLVSVGDFVSQKDMIARIGTTGQSTGPHLHFEIRVNGYRQNPLNYY